MIDHMVHTGTIDPRPTEAEREKRALQRAHVERARRFLAYHVSPRDIPRGPKGPRPVLYYRDAYGNTDIEIPPKMAWDAVEGLAKSTGMTQLPRRERRAMAKAARRAAKAA